MIAALGAHLVAGGAEPSDLRAATDPGLPVSTSIVSGRNQVNR
jgi:N6-L-threonylcarbamoyladenine synthase